MPFEYADDLHDALDPSDEEDYDYEEDEDNEDEGG